MRLDAEKRRTYGAGRRPIATYSVAGRFGIEILDEIEIPWCGDFRPCVVWRWSDEPDSPRMSCVRDLANDDSGFRAGRAWIPLSKCVRA